MWYAKMYFSEGREIFQYDSLGTQGVPDVQKEFPFLESLLAFQELDCAEVTPILQSITDNWSRFIAEDDRDALENFKRKLGRLASIHIYFRLLYVHCRYRQSAMYIQNDRGSAEDAQILDELRQLPEQLPLYQQQIQRFLIWCWMWTARDGSRRHRRQKITFTTLRKIPTCFRSAPSRSALSRWSRGGVRRCCIPPASGT